MPNALSNMVETIQKFSEVSPCCSCGRYHIQMYVDIKSGIAETYSVDCEFLSITPKLIPDKKFQLVNTPIEISVFNETD